jgi:hypothetical protein
LRLATHLATIDEFRAWRLEMLSSVNDLTSPTEEAGSVPIVREGATLKESPRAYLNPARRNLTEAELTSPGAIRLLISESDRLEERCATLEATASKYNDLRVEKAVLEAKLKSSKWHEVLSGLCLAIGAFGLAQGQRLLSEPTVHDVGIAVITVSALLVIAGIASKVWK